MASQGIVIDRRPASSKLRAAGTGARIQCFKGYGVSRTLLLVAIMNAVTGLALGAILLLSLTSVIAQNNCNLRSRIVTYRYWINYPYTYGTYQVLEYYCDFSEHPSSLPEGLLRLAEQDTQPHHVEGRPEVYHSGEWGTICDNGWDSNDAHAVCQQLGFSGPDQTCCSSQGSGTGRVWLENLQCDITDDWISQDCDVSTWGSTCDHSQDAGVRCERTPRVRLVNGNDVNILRGRVEYRYGNAWGKVCDDYWDEHDSQVVCHQLGFGSHTSFTTHTTTNRTIDAFGVDYGAYFLMDNLFCFGSEIALHHCAHNGWENHNCLYYEVVGVYCSMPTPRVSAGGSSSSSLHVTLEMLEGLQYSVTIIGYQVEYRERGDGDWIPKMVDATSYRHSFNLTELNAYTTYEIRAAVRVREFASESLAFSNVLPATTFEGAPGEVSNLSVVAASATSITVKWDEPEQTNGRISDYVLTYMSLTAGIPHSGKIVTDSIARAYTLTGLQEYTNYSVTILARTMAAEGIELSGQATTAESAPSGFPNDVEAIPQGPNSIRLSWWPPDFIRQNGPITGYDVMYSEGDISNTTSLNNSTTVFILKGLQPYTTYSISVAAINSQGIGPFSAAIEQTTLEAPPSGPPLDVSLTVLSAESLQVTWQSLSLENGQVSMYTIHWGQNMSNPTVAVVQGDAVSYRITGAIPFTVYHARVAASTSGGQGPFSLWSTDKTLTAAPTAAPLSVSVVGIRSTSANVTWLPPPEDTHNGLIIAYMVVFGMTTSSAPLGGAEVSDALQYTVSNLQPYTQFYVKVAAKTSAGVGPYSGNRTFNTLSDVPASPPENVSLHSHSSQAAITVSWLPLSSQYYNSDELKGYCIHYEANNVRINFSGDVSVGPTTTTRILTGLHERVAYTISVAAVNAEGAGPYSSELTVTTSGQVPESAPVGVSATATSSSSIEVEWSSPLVPDHQLPILSYTVSYLLIGHLADPQNVTVISVEDDTHSTSITGLEAYRQYVITVYSNNREGSSPPSGAVTVRTLSDIPLFAPNFTSSLVLSTRITLMWQPLTQEQARGNIAQYFIHWSGGPNLMLGPNTISHQFSVEPSTTYNFTIAASTSGGIGPYSDTFTVTSQDGIPSAPRDFRARTMSPTAIQLTWQNPSSPNGAYVYLITIIAEGDNNETISEIQVDSSLTAYTVDGLEENTFYEFFLRAMTSAGKGERVIARAQTWEARPSSPPLNVTAMAVNATAIHVSWETPPISHHNAPLTGFRVEYRNTVLLLSSTNKEIEVASPEQLYAVVVGLTPYTTYSVKVAVVNSVGSGPYSKEVSVQTLKSEPSQPQGLSITTVSSTQLNVSWSQPDYPNGIFLGYILTFEASYPPDIQSSGEELPGPDATYLLVVDLHPGTSYNIYLLARNDFGNSERVDGTGYTQPKVPTASPLVSAAPLSSTSLTVTWSPPSTTTWKGTIQKLLLLYGLVVYNETEDTMEQKMTIPVYPLAQPNEIAGTVNLTGLTAFTEYYVRMSLVNDAGEGPYADKTSTMTLQGIPSTVRDLTVHVNHTNVTATWSTPAKVNGELLFYKVYLDDAFLEKVPSSSYKITIDSLEPRSLHTVSVSAVTGAGEGKTSKIAFQTGDAYSIVTVASGQTAGTSGSSILYLLIGAAVAIVFILVVIVFLLGVIAWRRIKAANARKSPGYAIDSIALYDDDAFNEQEGYQVQENPFSKAMKDETYASPGSINPVYLEMKEEFVTYDRQLDDLEETLANYQSGDYYESGEKSDKKPFF